MNLVEVERAVGLILVREVTEIGRDPARKRSAFRRGHNVTEQDVPQLLVRERVNGLTAL